MAKSLLNRPQQIDVGNKYQNLISVTNGTITGLSLGF
jgi:hypothetical protein